jgi:hypothetical protein
MRMHPSHAVNPFNGRRHRLRPYLPGYLKTPRLISRPTNLNLVNPPIPQRLRLHPRTLQLNLHPNAFLRPNRPIRNFRQLSPPKTHH